MIIFLNDKKIYGWTKVNENGKIVLPVTAVNDYNLVQGNGLIITFAVKSSEAIGITSGALLENSSLSFIIKDYPGLINKSMVNKEPVMINQKYYCGLVLNNDLTIELPPAILKRYQLNAGDFLLITADSEFAIGLVVQGSIIKEAKKNPDLPVFS